MRHNVGSRAVTNGIGPACRRRGYSTGVAARRCPVISRMNTPNPYIALDLSELAPLCTQRVGRLRAKDWTTPAERDLLREDTALLLDAVARHLGISNGNAQPADAITLSELVGSIEYGRLSSGTSAQVARPASPIVAQKAPAAHTAGNNDDQRR